MRQLTGPRTIPARKGGTSSGPGNGSSGNNGAAGTATTSQPASTASAAGTLRQATSAEPKASPPPNPAACVTGTWKSVTSDGTETLYADGSYNNSGPLEALPGAVPYQCSSNTLRESFPTGAPPNSPACASPH